jgi:hypothetical protein
MKVALSELVNSRDALSRLLARDAPARVAFKLGDVAAAVGPKLDQYETQRVALVRKHGKEQADGSCKVEADGLGAFSEEHDGLVGVEVDLPFEKLTLNEIESLMLTGTDASTLCWLIDPTR